MAEASFSRKPAVSGLKITGTLTRKSSDGAVPAAVDEADAAAIMATIVRAIDGTDFDTETLRVKVG